VALSSPISIWKSRIRLMTMKSCSLTATPRICHSGSTSKCSPFSKARPITRYKAPIVTSKATRTPSLVTSTITSPLAAMKWADSTLTSTSKTCHVLTRISKSSFARYASLFQFLYRNLICLPCSSSMCHQLINSSSQLLESLIVTHSSIWGL